MKSTRQENTKIFELLELMQKHTCLPQNYPLHHVASPMDEEKIIKPSVYHALELIENMVRDSLDALRIFKILKMVVCTHTCENTQRLICIAIREAIILKYIV